MSQFPDEMVHLKEIRERIGQALSCIADRVDRYDQEYMDSKRYVAEFRSDPKEVFQSELLLKDIERAGISAVRERDKLKKLLDSPYFGRVDFNGDEEWDSGVFYVGSFSYVEDCELLICDWRAPVAGMFYDCELGRASFEAPAGCITGELTRKRQFRISRGELEYVLESSANIQDDVLQRELARTSDEKMKSIIATIQKEQNRIIRRENAEVLIIQGAAGSGKTSIALHRVAYLLYRFKDTLRAENIAILSPNRVFGDYIRGVLPELGEEPIFEMSFADIAAIHLGTGWKFQADCDASETADQSWAERVQYKSTWEFFQQLDTYLNDAVEQLFQPTDYSAGSFSVGKEWLRRRYLAYRRQPVKTRLQQVAEDVHDKFTGDNLRAEDVPGRRTILKDLTAMLAVKTPLELYKAFYEELGRGDMLVTPAKKTLEWADVYPFLYTAGKLEGLKEGRLIRHLVIDEMQDYTPVQYAVINMIFPCQKTILGDFGQALNPNHRHSLKDVQAVYGQAGQLEVLKTSYRSTYEIITFAKGIQRSVDLEPVKRHGEEPRLICCRDAEAELTQVTALIREFESNENATLGIILKTSRLAEEFWRRLSAEAADLKVALITADSKEFHSGVSVVSTAMSKGLEFDEVIIPCVNGETYSTEADRNLLYVACTRAMHKLALTAAGTLTALLRPTDETRQMQLIGPDR